RHSRATRDALPICGWRCIRWGAAGPLLRSVDDDRLSGRGDDAAEAVDLRPGRAAPAGDVDREDAGDDRCAFEGTAYRRCGRRMDEGGIRGAFSQLPGSWRGDR